MELRIQQFRYGADNFAYLVYGEREALAIDGGAVDAMLSFAVTNKLAIAWATHTHAHPDHTAGTRDLLRESRAQYIDVKDLPGKKKLELEGERIFIYHTPGHTMDSVCFHTGNLLITGDTLFNGTIGNCFSGNPDVFLKSIKQLMALPDDTRIYAGHDYVRESVAFAKALEPEHADLIRRLDHYLNTRMHDHLYSTMNEEKQVNPYLRFNDAHMTALMALKGLPVETETDRWHSLMGLE